MAENEKPEIEYHAPVIEFDNKKSLITKVGFTAGATEKFEIVWLIPETDEECKARYDCDLRELIIAGVRQLTTRPDYKSSGWDEEGNLLDDGHEAMQALADNYIVGRRAVAGPNQKAKAKKLDAVEAQAKEAGYDSVEAMMAEVAKLKKAGKI